MRTLLPQAIFGLVISFAILVGIGCSSLLTKQATPISLPVTMGAATTNDPVAVAWEKAALQLNAQYNATSSEPLLAGLGGVLVTLTSAFAGWYARHHTATVDAKATLTATEAKVPPA